MAVVIKRAHTKDVEGGYFTEMGIVQTVPVVLNKIVVGHNNIYRPKFDGMNRSHASQFNTEADAQALIDDPDYGGPEAFANCTIE